MNSFPLPDVVRLNDRLSCYPSSTRPMNTLTCNLLLLLLWVKTCNSSLHNTYNTKMLENYNWFWIKLKINVSKTINFCVFRWIGLYRSILILSFSHTYRVIILEYEWSEIVKLKKKKKKTLWCCLVAKFKSTRNFLEFKNKKDIHSRPINRWKVKLIIFNI